MPKIQKLRKHKVESKPYSAKEDRKGDKNQTTAAGAASDGSDKAGAGAGAVAMLSRGQKKRQQRKDRITNVKAMIENSNNPTADGKKSKTTFLFSDLESSLPQNADIVRPSAAPPKTNKMKGKVAIREVERMKLIQDHPSFKLDPLAALKFHIEHMVAVQPVVQR
jgi:hypothetical protein